MAGLDKIKPDDQRTKHGYTDFEGHRWHYLDVAASGKERGVVFLIHGWPDISLAWRYQIPVLASLGLRSIALDCMGYGDTGSSSSLEHFTFKHHSNAIAAIAKELGYSRIILGGHDWGGMVVYRAAQFHPELISHVFSVATPYIQVSDDYIPTEALVKGPLPNFGYQLQLGSQDQKVEKVVKDEASIRKFLTGAYGGRLSSGKEFFTAERGMDIEAFVDEKDTVEMTPLLDEQELDYYVKEFSKNGMNGPCNWYRTRRANYEAEQTLPDSAKNNLQQPVLFIQALHDSVLKPEMSKSMEKFIPNLTRGEVPSSHWALWHTPQQTNHIIKNWVEGVVFGGKSKL